MNDSMLSHQNDLVPPTPLTLKLNGESVTSNAKTIAGLLREQGLDPERPGMAVALNQTLVLRSSWNEQSISDGDHIEVITAMQGG